MHTYIYSKKKNIFLFKYNRMTDICHLKMTDIKKDCRVTIVLILCQIYNATN